MAKDYYNVLGIDRDASPEEIKDAYKQLAKKFHPDISKEKNAEEKFKEVHEAYSVLSDSQKRSNYDRFGDAAERFTGFSGFGSGDFYNFDFDLGDLFEGLGGFGRTGFGDLFRESFGGRTRPRGPARGENLRFDLAIDFEEAVFGTEKEITIERIEKCSECNGSGSASGSGLTICNVCNGTGVEEKVRRTMFGLFSTRTTCSRCRGEGKTVKDPCKKCNGLGRAKKKVKIKVKIPEGINTGNHLRLRGEGNAGERGASHGDLFVVIFVEPHEVFKRDQSDIFCEIPLSFSEAALGGELSIPTLKGSASLKIPVGTQSNTVFKLRGIGVKELGGTRIGDQYVKVLIKTPEKLNAKQKELFEELAKLEKLKAERESFFEKIKKKFGKN